MHPIFYYIIFFLAVGAIGFAIANKKATAVQRRQRWLKYATYVPITGIVVLSMFYGFFKWVACGIVALGLAELARVNFSNTIKRTSPVIFSFIVYLLTGAGFVAFAFTTPRSHLLFIYIQVIVFDGFCQITGQIFGKHPIAPTISPSKTWEGFFGGWICCILTAITAANWIAVPVYIAALYGFITGLACLGGDMLASYYKRKTHIKDYSNWLPGHGGFLDRFDSFLMAGAVYYLLYLIIFSNYFEELSVT